MKRFVRSFCVELLFRIIQDFLCRTSKFTIYEKMLMWAHLLFKIRLISFIDDIVRIKICCLCRETMIEKCFYVDIKRKILEPPDDKVYTWK